MTRANPIRASHRPARLRPTIHSVVAGAIAAFAFWLDGPNIAYRTLPRPLLGYLWSYLGLGAIISFAAACSVYLLASHGRVGRIAAPVAVLLCSLLIPVASFDSCVRSLRFGSVEAYPWDRQLVDGMRVRRTFGFILGPRDSSSPDRGFFYHSGTISSFSFRDFVENTRNTSTTARIERCDPEGRTFEVVSCSQLGMVHGDACFRCVETAGTPTVRSIEVARLDDGRVVVFEGFGLTFRHWKSFEERNENGITWW